MALNPTSKPPRRIWGPTRKQLLLQSKPFLDDTLMEGPPSHKLADMKRAQVRKCPFDVSSIRWEEAETLGSGLDGWVWKVYFGDKGPFVIKMFWVSEQPTVPGEDFAFQNECQNVAFLQMIQASVKAANDEGGSHPPMVFAEADNLADAKLNLASFAEEKRLKPQPEGLVPITTVPRIRECYGWFKFTLGDVLPRIPEESLPHTLKIEKVTREPDPDREYGALVYEFVEPGESEPAKVDKFVEFLRLAGFSLAGAPHGRNWASNVLLDLSDIASPISWSWRQYYYTMACRPRIHEICLKT